VTASAQALLVVDVQLGWMEGRHSVNGADELRATLGGALDAARRASALVVFLQDVGDRDASVPQGSPGRELALAPAPGELVVPKEDDDGFVGTDLESVLRDAGVTSVVVTGIQSEMCVASTARGALERGFTVILPRDAHSTHDIPAHGAGVAVPAAHVRRVAEWSLGDDVLVLDRAADVRFEAALRR
jgi:streptothricin hydrolase